MKIFYFSTLPPFLLSGLLPHKLLALWSTYYFFLVRSEIKKGLIMGGSFSVSK